jgi:hypothetical protein
MRVIVVGESLADIASHLMGYQFCRGYKAKGAMLGV